MRNIFLILLLAACTDGDGDASTAPAAPTNLAVSNVSGGGHLTWSDNSSNEDQFMIMRKTATTAFDDIDMVPFNTTQYHDSAVAAGMAYTYKITAMNAKGEASSNEVMFAP